METIHYQVEDRVAKIQMMRTDVKNAINETMHKELYEAFRKASIDDDVSVIMLTGTAGSFSSGADLKSIPVEDMETFDHGDYLERTYNRLLLLMEEITKPTVAFINGTAVGAGLSLALACDFRYAVYDAKLALSFMQIGLTPDAGASYFLPRIVGLAKALELGTGKHFSGEEAYHLGLVNGIGEPSELIEQLKLMPVPAYGLMKQNMKFGMSGSLQDVLEAETSGQRVAGKSEQHIEAVSAFLKK
ncbi:enoyl-CoA hydratase/isomerase family protein [Salisediminibacterium halotolerans]|uniref:2-(1,2-epoxy-1,2-dihydrophenyl)acetyl-CoA isomerase n=1 Tax=Salisediminibacterium halotolerans TaxID=517425 RepID=A0A1H9QWP5_9BACI|nr:enoyl-CoA hydratase-related protein [Salisediminibacterium haloalkalitolerans]SER64655.1 2-(1,2-epoxy-1,2-dihydrophenyl)acetyl-CoA isomerase [Salisediminibacterium haloalkalitolerans]